MESTITSNSRVHHGHSISTNSSAMFNWGTYEFNRFAIISMLIILVGCLGGVTVGFGAINHTLQLSLVVFTTMGTLVCILAVAPMKWIMGFSVVAVFLDLILLAVNNLG